MKSIYIKNLISRRSKIVTSLFFVALSLAYLKAFATPPGTPYNPGETLDPTCAPMSANCYVGINSSQWTTSASDIYYNTGNVGIGTSSPTGMLTIMNAATPTTFLTIGNNPSGRYVVVDDHILRFGDVDNNTGALFTINHPANKFTFTNGSVGIGTSNPGAKLDVNGDALINGLTLGRGTANLSSNTIFGQGAYTANTTGFNNVAIGQTALSHNTIGANNVAIGVSAMDLNIDGFHDTAVGVSALGHNTSGYYNSAFGKNALSQNDLGYQNTGVGWGVLGNITSGHDNTAIGYNTGLGISTGNYNTIIGGSVGGLSASLSNTVIIADGQGNKRIYIDNNGYTGISNSSPSYLLHAGSAAYGGFTVARFQNAGGTCDVLPATPGGITCTSDQRLKKNIATVDYSILDKILNTHIVNYNLISEQDGAQLHTGVLAQELEQIFPDLVSTDQLTGNKSVAYTGLVPYVIKSIQELDIKIQGFSSLDTTKVNTLGSFIKQFLGDIGNSLDIVFFGEVHTKKLCLEDVCVTKDQLQQLLNTTINNGNGGSGSGGGNPPPPPADGPTDVCPNIDGDQPSIPDSMHLDNSNNCVADDVPPPLENPPTDTTL